MGKFYNIIIKVCLKKVKRLSSPTMYQFVCLVLFFCSLATCQSSCSYPFEILPPYNNVSVVSIISSSNNGVYQCGNNGGATYWLQIYPQNSEPITLSTCNLDTYFNPVISAFLSTSTSDPCGHLQCLGTISSNNYSCPTGHGNQMIIYPGVYSNTVFYLIGITGLEAHTFNLTISQPSTCQAARPLYPSLAITGNFQSAYYFPQGVDPCNTFNSYWGLMFQLHPKEGINVVTSCSPDTTISTKIVLYSSNSPCGPLSCLQKQNFACAGQNSASQVNVTISNLNLFYYAAIFAYVGTNGYPPDNNFAISLFN